MCESASHALRIIFFVFRQYTNNTWIIELCRCCCYWRSFFFSVCLSICRCVRVCSEQKTTEKKTAWLQNSFVLCIYGRTKRQVAFPYLYLEKKLLGGKTREKKKGREERQTKNNIQKKTQEEETKQSTLHHLCHQRRQSHRIREREKGEEGPCGIKLYVDGQCVSLLWASMPFSL